MFFMLNWVTGRCICMEYNPYYLSSPLDHASASQQAAAAPTEDMKEEGSPTDINEAAHTAVFLIITGVYLYIERSENVWSHGGDFFALCTVV